MGLGNYLTEDCDCSVSQYCGSQTMALSIHFQSLSCEPSTHLPNQYFFFLCDVLHPFPSFVSLSPVMDVLTVDPLCS